MPKKSHGVTLVELMVAIALLSVGVLGFFGAFQFITKSISVSRARTLSTNLAQERVEALKNLNYYALLITTASATDNTFTPGLTYDNGNYAPETISIGGVEFKRYTYVSLAQIDGNVISTVTYTYPDTGMKQITVHVTWTQLGERKKWTLSNILENPNVNPLDSSFSGTISSAVTLAVIPGALVKVQENPDWNATTDAAGFYTFRVYHGSYTIRVTSGGYYDTSSNVQTAVTGSNTSLDLSMIRIASGTISGSVWITTNPVISQVVGASSTICADGAPHDVEYVELFNPTTYTINVGNNNTYPKAMSLAYFDEDSGHDKADSLAGFNFTYVSTHIPPGRYYLISNASSFVLGGSWRTADAYYGTLYDDLIREDKAGALQILTPDGQAWDTVGWTDNNNNAPKKEGTQLDLAATDGLGTDKQIVRVSSPGCSAMDSSTYGRAYDSGSNIRDFIREGAGVTGIVYSPRRTTDAAPIVIAGRPGIGAYVSASDTYSGSTIAYAAYVTSGALNLPYATYNLLGVTTGTWTLTIASAAVYKDLLNVTSTGSLTSWVSTTTTNPAWRLANNFGVYLDSAHIGGFVEGRVTSITGAAIPNITVLLGGTSKVTGTNGNFFSKVSSGSVSLIANPGNANTTYVQSIVMVDVETGEMVTQNFILSQGGTLSGFATTGTTPVPNVVVTANISGSQFGTGTSDATGVWTIPNLSTGVYTVSPVLEAGMDSNPNSYTATVTAGATVTVGTFTVLGAFGSITGTVTQTVSGVTGLVTQGALILASTATIASSPPSICGSSAPAQVPLYAVSSKADGTYILPVRGTATAYNLSVYIPTIAASGTVTTTTKTYTGAVTVSAGLPTTKDIVVP